MQFEFATAGRIVFGEGAVREVPAAAAAMGTRALLVTGSSPERAAPLLAGLETAGVACVPFAVAGEPTVELIRQASHWAPSESFSEPDCQISGRESAAIVACSH